MNVADLELSNELFNLTGWYSDYVYQNTRTEEKPFIELKPFTATTLVGRDGVIAPAYPLGFLVEKITRVSSIKIRLNKGKYIATAPNHYHFEGPTLEDVACKFVIGLLKLKGSE